jgi:hypothetical protein
MAKTTRVVLVCDLHGDGTEAVTTMTSRGVVEKRSSAV